MKPRRIRDRKLLDSFRGERCILCYRAAEACHVKSRGAGGHDLPENLLAMCRTHHQSQHALGWNRFLKRNPVAALTLESKGWVIKDVLGVMKLVHEPGRAKRWTR